MISYKYDVFISYKTEDRPWVEWLGRALEQEQLDGQNLRVFIDFKCIEPGAYMVEALEDAVRHSRMALLVASPAAMTSGWCRDEYMSFTKREKKAESDFRFIPLLLDPDTEMHEFLENKQYIDCSRRDNFDSYYERIRAAVLGTQISDLPPFAGRLNRPPLAMHEVDAILPNVTGWVDDAMAELVQPTGRNIVALAAPAGQLSGVEYDLIKTRIAQKELATQTIVLSPAAASEDAWSDELEEQFFIKLGQQAGSHEPTCGKKEFQDFLRNRTTAQRRLAVIVKGFEHGHPDGMQSLSKVLRALLDDDDVRIYVVAFGAVGLAHTCLGNGESSLLSTARYLELPSPSPSDLQEWCRQTQKMELPDKPVEERTQTIELSDEHAEKLFFVSGGHTQLIQPALDALHRCEFSEEGAIKELSSHFDLWRTWSRLAKRGEIKDELREKLENPTLATSWSPYWFDVTLRALHWCGFTCRDYKSNQLVWRCEAVRQAGFRVMEQIEGTA